MSARPSRFVHIAAAVLLVGAVMIVPAVPAGATTTVAVDAECLGSFARTFNPPITLTPQSVTATATYTYSTCVVGPTAIGTVTNTVTLACIPVVPGVPPETESVTWLDGSGDTSTIVWSNATAVGQTVVLTGVVSTGRHAGDTAVKITSGVSYVGGVIGCLLGTPIAGTNGLVDSLLLTS